MRSLWLLLAVVTAGALHAHETMFGRAPRPMWKNGIEVEAETAFEFGHDYFSGAKRAPNPDNVSIFHHHYELGASYGLPFGILGRSDQIGIRADLPLTYALRTSTNPDDPDRSFMGINDWSIRGSYAPWFGLFPFNGGSAKLYAFGGVCFPSPVVKDEFHVGDENWKWHIGLAESLSTTRAYLWSEVYGAISSQNGGTGDGPEGAVHVAGGWRLRELKDYRDIDPLVLVEFDYMAHARGRLEGAPDPNSGSQQLHVGLAFQCNFTNRIEAKIGYNIPVYRYFRGTQFESSSGELAIMVSYLFR